MEVGRRLVGGCVAEVDEEHHAADGAQRTTNRV
jgi:hypothetical protein